MLRKPQSLELPNFQYSMLLVGQKYHKKWFSVFPLQWSWIELGNVEAGQSKKYDGNKHSAFFKHQKMLKDFVQALSKG